MGLDGRRERKITLAILDEIVKTINNIGAITVFADLDNSFSEVGEYLSRYCKNESIYYISTFPYFMANAKKGVQFKAYGGHWNAVGNRIAAEAIKDYLLNEGIVK